MAASEVSDSSADIDPTLAEVVGELSRTGFWAMAWDTAWRPVAMTDELAGVHGDNVLFGVFAFSPESLERLLQVGTLDENRAAFRHLAPWVLTDLDVTRDELRAMVHPGLRDIVDELEPKDGTATSYEVQWRRGYVSSVSYVQRVRDPTGLVVGTVIINKPNVGMNTIALLTSAGDLDHFHRMMQLGELRRRPAALLFADLEGSTALSKRLPTASYFTLVRRITKAADECVIAAGGLVGRHVGDGVTAFFVAETAGSESTAARGCIGAARSLQAAMMQVAERHGVDAKDLTVRAGLHWGATPFIGSIVTVGRSEVTALGDEVNEAARIEACATGGRLLASKALIERLGSADLASLDIDLNTITYAQLSDLDTATDKARRDAPAIPVCDVSQATR